MPFITLFSLYLSSGTDLSSLCRYSTGAGLMRRPHCWRPSHSSAGSRGYTSTETVTVAEATELAPLGYSGGRTT